MRHREWLPKFRDRSPPDTVDCAAEAYFAKTLHLVLGAGQLSTPCGLEFIVISFATSMEFLGPQAAKECQRYLYDNGAITFLHLAARRQGALSLERYITSHPNDIFKKQPPWQEAGYAWKCPFPGFNNLMIAPEPLDRPPSQPRSRSLFPYPSPTAQIQPPRLRPRTPARPPGAPVYRAAEAVRQTDIVESAPSQFVRQHEQDRPRSQSAMEPASPSSPSTPPWPQRDWKPRTPSRLGQTMCNQADERSSEEDKKSVDPKKTSKQSPKVNLEKGRPATDFSSLSSYRPVAVPPMLASPFLGAIAARAPPIKPENRVPALSPALRQLRSSELFPDKYQNEQATTSLDNAYLKPRDSVAENAGSDVRDFARSEAAEIVPPEGSINRRNANRSESDRSSVSSTSSSRAQRLLESNLENDKAARSTNEPGSTSSLGLTSVTNTFRGLFNALLPSASDSPLTSEKRRRSQSPSKGCRKSTRRQGDGSRAGNGGAGQRASGPGRRRANTRNADDSESGSAAPTLPPRLGLRSSSNSLSRPPSLEEPSPTSSREGTTNEGGAPSNAPQTQGSDSCAESEFHMHHY